MPVCGMNPIECTTPSSLLPSPITSVTRPASESRCSGFCTSSSSSGAGLGSRSAMRWISFIRSNPVSTSSAPASWACLAMWNAIELSVMIPVTRMRLPSRKPVIGKSLSLLVAHAHAAIHRDDRAGDVACVFGSKEADRSGHFLAGADPLGGDEFQRTLLDALVQRPGHLGVDVAGGEEVRGDTGLGQLT